MPKITAAGNGTFQGRISHDSKLGLSFQYLEELSGCPVAQHVCVQENARRTRITIVLLILLLFWSSGCSKPQPSTKPKIAATIFPLCDIARNIVGDRMDVVEILPPGASPHTYQVTPQHVEGLRGVRIIFRIGHGLDDWAGAIADVAPDAGVVVVDKGIRLIYSTEGGREHGAANPHYWLSPDNGMIIARNIEQEVARLDSRNEPYYKTNLETYLAKIAAAKKEVEQELSGLPDRTIITFHDAYAYLAAGFGLNIVGTFEPSPGKEPTPGDLARLERNVRAYHIKAVFTEPELSSAAVESFVKDMGLTVYVLDPLGGFDQRDSYIALLKYDAAILAKALSQ